MPRPSSEQLENELLWYAAAAHRRQPLMAAVLLPRADDPVLAYLDVREHAFPPAQVTPESIADEMRRPDGPYFRPPAVSERRLPSGRAVRYSAVFPEPSAEGAWRAVEQATHFVLPDGFPGEVLEFTVTWQDIALGEALGELADGLAASLRVG